MTRKEGTVLPPGIYKIHWKSGGWSWGAIGYAMRRVSDAGKFMPLDRPILCYHWAGELPGSVVWRKIARVERARLEKMEGER